jgi:pSer/pThr/pTyr-binding forkhead associated (FHA) protein
LRLLHQPFALVGRDQRADVPLDHKLVSRRHVYIQIVNGQAFWIDLESRSGTLSDGQLHKLGWLEAGKSIGVGPFELRRQLPAHSMDRAHHLEGDLRISPLVARSQRDQQLPEVALEFLNGPSRSACWPMNRVMSLVGSAEGCKFRLADPSVSPFHCSLVRTPLGLWVVDLLAPNSVTINDALMRYAQLTDHDVLRVGRYRVRMHIKPVVRSSEAITAMINVASIVPRSELSHGVTLAQVISDRGPEWNEAALSVGKNRPAQARTTSVEWLSPAVNEALRPERAELAESVLVPLVNQFGLMQEQMLDQFQQTISTLVHAFSKLHREQMSLVREELDHLRDLTKEFHSLKHELAVRSLNPSQRELASPLPDAERQRTQRVTQQAKGSIVPAPEPTAAASSEAASIGSDPGSTIPVSESEGVKNIAFSPNPLASPHLRATGAASRAHSTPEGVKLESDRDVMVWLHDRMTTLQQERETRWQRILKLLPGVS